MNNNSNSTQQPSFTFKVYFKPGNQVRRLKFGENITLNEFKTSVAQLGQCVSPTTATTTPLANNNNNNNPVTVVQYLDEENDWISVSSEEEWREALHQHKLLLSQTPPSIQKFGDALFKVKFITLPKKPETSSSNTSFFSRPYTSSSSSSICRRETWEPYIEQVKESGKKMQPYLSQAKEVAVENAKKVQELVTDSQKQQEFKQWFHQWFEKLMREGQQTQHKIGEWLKELDNIIDSFSKSLDTTSTTSASTSSSFQAPQTTFDNDLPTPSNFDEEEEEEEDNDSPTDDYVVIVNEPLLPELPSHHTQDHMYPETTTPEYQEEEEEPQQQQQQQQQEHQFLESTIPEEYLTKLDSLLDMGFTDRELNMELLRQNNGDLVKVVSELLSASL